MTLMTTVEIAEQRLAVLAIEPDAIHTKSPVYGKPYAKHHKGCRLYLWTKSWTPDELRAIATHMEALEQ